VSPRRRRRLPGQRHVGVPYRIVFIVMAAREDLCWQDPSERRAREFARRAEPLLEAVKKDGVEKPLMDIIHEMLGQDWAPRGRWAVKIAKMAVE